MWLQEWLLQLLRSDAKEVPKTNGFYGALAEDLYGHGPFNP